MGCKPIEIANIIAENLPKTSLIGTVEVAGPGFINFEALTNYS